MTVTRVPASNPEPEEEAPVTRTLCLALSDDRNMPLQCRFRLAHTTRHDWEIDLSPLTQGRAERLREEQDTPSGRLPVRTPGAALRDEEGSDGPGGPGEAARPSDRECETRTVTERWTA